MNITKQYVSFLFKYFEKQPPFNRICPGELFGKIYLEGNRSCFKKGIYFTLLNNNQSRLLEDVLAITFTPHISLSISNDPRVLKEYTLINNEDKPIDTNTYSTNIKRVWPAFGMAGGASEIIAVPKKYGEINFHENNSINYQNYETDDCELCISGDCVAKIGNSPRFQIFHGDNVRPLDTNYFQIYSNVLTNIRKNYIENRFFKSGKEEYFFFKITKSGLTVKFNYKQKNDHNRDTDRYTSGKSFDATLSAGIIKQDDKFYGYVIGAVWDDSSVCLKDLTVRKLWTSSPYLFTSKIDTTGGLEKQPNEQINKILNCFSKFTCWNYREVILLGH